MTAVPTDITQAREHFLGLVGELRPELHRYCARLTGSVVDGEDVVQETLAKGLYALSMATEIPPLRPWLFRVAHNTAIDLLRRHDRRAEPLDDDVPEPETDAGPDAVHAALSTFLELPIRQRSAVILKDVLGQSLEEVAETMGATVLAVKAALVRGRATLREAHARASDPPIEPAQREALQRYAALFNARDWDALRALLSDECRLDLVAKASRRGREVHGYFARYAAEQVRVEPGTVDGRPALLAYAPPSATVPSYFILVEWSGERVSFIRDYRYVPYIASEL